MCRVFPAKRFIPLALLVLAIGTLSVWLGFRLGARWSEPRPGREILRSKALEMTGLHLESWIGEDRVSLHADRLVHRSRRFGPWTINALKEIEFHGVTLVVDESVHADRGPFFQEGVVPTIRGAFAHLLSVQKLGFVSRVSVVGFDLRVRRSGDATARLRAGRLRFEMTEREMTLSDGVVVRSPTGNQLEAQEARWDRGTGRLSVRGGFTLQREGEALQGETGAVSVGGNGEIVVE